MLRVTRCVLRVSTGVFIACCGFSAFILGFEIDMIISFAFQGVTRTSQPRNTKPGTRTSKRATFTVPKIHESFY
jgi:hypothetical protein